MERPASPGEAGPSGVSPAQTSPAQAPDFCILYCKYGMHGWGLVPGNFFWGRMNFLGDCGWARLAGKTPEYGIFVRSAECLNGTIYNVQGISGNRYKPMTSKISSKTGQPMAAVRFSVYAGQIALYGDTRALNLLPPPKEIPRRRAPGILYLQYRMHGWGPAPGRSGRGRPPRDRPLRGRRASPRSSPMVEPLLLRRLRKRAWNRRP